MNRILNLFKYSALALAITASFSANADDAQIQAMQLNMLKLQNQVQDLQSKLADSEGQIESLNHDLQVLQQENSDLKSKLAANSGNTSGQNGSDNTDANAQTAQNAKTDPNTNANNTNSIPINTVTGNSGATLSKSKVQTQSTAAATPSAGSDSSLPVADAQAVKMYQSAYNLLVKNKLSESATGFSNYVTKYPNNSLTPNAWYWLGQVQYKQKKYQDARVSFLNTAKFKGSTKRADALYKLGVTSKALGDKDKAKKFFEVLIKTYPTSSSTALAKKELAKGAQEHRGALLALTVDGDHELVALVDLKLKPGTAGRDDLGLVDLLARIHLGAVVHTRGTDELRDDDTLGTVDDEGALIGHHGEVAHEDELLLDLAGLLVGETDVGQKRSLIGHILLAALLDGVRGVAELMLAEGNLENMVLALDGAGFLERLTKALVLKTLKGFPLNRDKVGELHGLRDFPEADALALSGSVCVGHQVFPPSRKCSVGWRGMASPVIAT